MQAQQVSYSHVPACRTPSVGGGSLPQHSTGYATILAADGLRVEGFPQQPPQASISHSCPSPSYIKPSGGYQLLAHDGSHAATSVLSQPAPHELPASQVSRSGRTGVTMDLGKRGPGGGGISLPLGTLACSRLMPLPPGPWEPSARSSYSAWWPLGGITWPRCSMCMVAEGGRPPPQAAMLSTRVAAPGPEAASTWTTTAPAALTSMPNMTTTWQSQCSPGPCQVDLRQG